MIISISQILTAAIRLATPYLYASIGETIGQRSGVMNLGVDGVMLLGAYTAFYVTLKTDSLLFGLAAAVVVGLFLGLVVAFISVTLKAQQTIAGIGLYMFGLGLSDLLFSTTIRSVTAVKGFPSIHIPGLSSIPILGETFFSHSILVYGAFLLIPISSFVLQRTRLGLKIRAVGENPSAADSLGVSVSGIRYLTSMVGGVLSAIAGASLSISLLNIFQQNLTNGMGFIAVALVYFGGWRPLGLLSGAMLFSVVNAIQMWSQVKGIHIPPDFMLMMPYVVTILILASMAKRIMHRPSALAKPFERGE